MRNLAYAVSIIMAISVFTCYADGGVSAGLNQGGEEQDLPSIEWIQEILTERYSTLSDITFVSTVNQWAPDSQQVLQSASFKLKAVIPGFIRITFTSPDIYNGVEYLLNQEKGQVLIHMPVTEMAQCQIVEEFLSTYNVPIGSFSMIDPSTLFAPPESDKMYEIEVIGVEVLDGKKQAIIQARPLPTGIEAVEEVVGEELVECEEDIFEIASTVVIRVWVDLELAMITKIEELDQEYKVNYTLEINNVEFNTGLQSDTLMKLPRGTLIEGCKN